MKSTKTILKILTWPFLLVGGNLYFCATMLLGFLPHTIVKKGDRFVAVEDIPITGLTHWDAPATFDFKCTIPRGTILVASSDSQRISRGFGCIPQDKLAFKKKFVPADTRTAEKYTGYSFVFKYSEIGKRLQKI